MSYNDYNNDYEITMKNMGRAYGDFKKLYEYYKGIAKIDKRMQDREEIERRIQELTKQGKKPRTELETLYWVLGEKL